MSKYRVKRQYEVEDTVYVEAEDAADAIKKAEVGDYDDVTDADPISKPKLISAKRADA